MGRKNGHLFLPPFLSSSFCLMPITFLLSLSVTSYDLSRQHKDRSTDRQGKRERERERERERKKERKKERKRERKKERKKRNTGRLSRKEGRKEIEGKKGIETM